MRLHRPRDEKRLSCHGEVAGVESQGHQRRPLHKEQMVVCVRDIHRIRQHDLLASTGIERDREQRMRFTKPHRAIDNVAASRQELRA